MTMVLQQIFLGGIRLSRYIFSNIKNQRNLSFGDAGFIVRSASGALVAAGGVRIFDTIIPMTKLHAA